MQRIPPAFVKQLSDDFPAEATLRDWSGNFWHMEIEEDKDGVFFKHGWEKFVKDNSLEHGDFVLFIYNGNSLFDVKVYGKNGCIKDEGLLANHCTNVEGRTHHNSVCNLKRKSAEESLITSTKFTGSCDANKRRSERVVSKFFEPSIANANTNIRRSGRVVWKNFEPSIANANERRTGRVVSKNFKPTIATYSSEFAATRNPHFVASVNPLKPYHLNIPAALLVKNCLELKPEMMFRDQNGKKWPVKVIIRRDGRHTFGTGWSDFWMKKDLNEHDKIRFEFVFLKGKKRLSKEIRVTIAHGKCE